MAKFSLKRAHLIGEGLNAKVYKLTKTSSKLGLKENLALKVFKKTKKRALFKKEFQVLQKVNGKRLVQYRGFKYHWFKPALLLEFIEGVTLHDLICTSDLSQDERHWIYKEVKLGLLELADSNLAHGDLSPKNIMISTIGQIKLIDFGVSHWSTQNIEVTPEFASEKVLTGTTAPSLETDLESLEKIFTLPKLKLQKTHQVQTKDCPESLKERVFELVFPQSYQTQALPNQKNLKRKFHFRIGYATKSFLAVSSFYLPPNYLNTDFKSAKLHIMSPNWASVSKDQIKWCFTPCSLNFDQKGVHTVYWKTRARQGKLSLYLPKSKNNLFLNTQKQNTSSSL